MKKSLDATRAACAALTLVLLIPALAQGVVQPKADSPLDQKAFRHPELYIRQQGKPIAELPAALAAKATADLSTLGGQIGYYDVRSGRWSLLISSRPLVAASGVTEAVARNAVVAYVAQFQAQLGILASEVGEPRVTVFDDGHVVQFHAQRVFNGVPVRDAWLKATINSGNLVLLGTQNWGSAAVATVPSLSREEAFERVKTYAGSPALTLRGSPELVVVPFEKGDDPNQVVLGDGLSYRLAWAVTAVARGDNGTWEGLVDAHTGEMLAFEDKNQYFRRKVMGGIFPVSNDGQSPSGIPDGVEQPGYPMPYAYMLGTNLVTNSMGIVTGVGSNVTSNFSGPYVRMNDICVPQPYAGETASCGDLDFGASGGTDCVVPPGHSAGDTHASRTGFYELNRQIESWRNRLPANATAQEWMNSQLTSNMNINAACNAFWDGSTINFYRSSAQCGNTGEIAAVFDHEWGHGLDNNGTDPSISLPGEAIADIYGILRLTDSCFGRGFFIGGVCGGYGSPCVATPGVPACSGVRDLDFARHECVDPTNPEPNTGKAWDITWINQVGYPVAQPCVRDPVTDEVVVQQGGCVGFNFVQTGPCGQETHCEGNVPAQAVIDLFKRDLQGVGGLTNYGFNTALEITTRLIAIAADNLATWYTCNQGSGGCAVVSGFMLMLAADDDNGNVLDGTPHMDAIFNAFNRHGIACPGFGPPIVANSGCTAVSPIAPVLTATAGATSASLSWGSVTGAAMYQVYRTEGVHGCEFGKVKVGETTGTTFVDTGLRDGFPVIYSVLPIGANPACAGRMSNCQTVTPTAPAVDADMAVTEVPNSLNITTGDGDPFLDNCEQATVSFNVENAGGVTLTNVRVAAVELVGKPASDIITPLPLLIAGSMPAGCPPLSPTQASITFRPQGLTFDETLEVRITVTADQLTSPAVGILRIAGTESSFEFQPTKTFNFETDFENWKLASGRYTRQPPGANATVTALYSSAALDNQCDNIRSPEVKLSATSTLSLYNMFNTEPSSPLGVYDRANVGLHNVATEARTPVSPDGGRLYTIGAVPNGACVTAGQAGWNGAGPGFLQSTWSAGALAPAGCVGQRCKIDVAYGTDPLVSGAGFQFDEVTITNFDLQVSDAGSNTCAPLPPPTRPDLVVTSIDVNNNKSVREGQKVTITATIKNIGTAPTGQVTTTTEFLLDGTTTLGRPETSMNLAPNDSTTVSILWDTRSVKGSHTIAVTTDVANAVPESDDGNNTSTRTVNIQGNKTKNSSFREPNSQGTGPANWEGKSTDAGSASWSDGGSDDDKSAATSGNGGNAGASGSPSWTSDPISVTPGEALTFAVSVSSLNASSAATAGLVYLGAAGNVLQTVNLLTAPLTTAGFAKLEQAVTIPAGVTQVRVKLVGFAPTDLQTSGTVRFDEVGLFGN